MALSKSKNVKGKLSARESNATLRHKMKLEMLRYCLVWNFNEEQTIAYFKKRGVKLALGYYYELKAEFKSKEATKEWYTEQAISAMESTHKISIEQLDALIVSTLNEVQQLQATPVYIEKDGEKILNPSHNSTVLAKMMDSFSSLVKLRDDMLAATPVVQAIMNKHALDREKSMTKP